MNQLHPHCCVLFTAIECPALSTLANGDISYTPDMTGPLDFATIATHSCNTGFFLMGIGTLRSCGGDGSSTVGIWNGTAPTCLGIVIKPKMKTSS